MVERRSVAAKAAGSIPVTHPSKLYNPLNAGFYLLSKIAQDRTEERPAPRGEKCAWAGTFLVAGPAVAKTEMSPTN